MLLRHSLYYLLARGIPGLVNFVALAVYTRLLAPQAFGQYALVVAGIGLADVVVFQWLRLVLARFWPAHKDDPQRLLAGILALFLLLALTVTGIGSLLALAWPDPVWQRLLALAVPLLLAQAWLEVTLGLAQIQLKPAWYGRILAGKAVIALALGGLLAWIGLGAVAPLTGLLLAHVLAFLLFALPAWRGIVPRWPAAAALRDQLRYGLPLTVTFALAWVITSSDRLLIAWLLDDASVGVYAAGYDLAEQGVMLLLTIVNTAAYPLAVHAMEDGGPTLARAQLVQNGTLIVAVGLMAAAGLSVLAPQIVAVLIGEQFRPGALLIMPWVGAAAAVAGIRAYHFDIAFHLGHKSHLLVITGGVAASANVVLNLLLIPRAGILGAAWATLAAFLLAALASAWLGRRVMAMPPLAPLLAPGAALAAVVGAAAWGAARLNDVTWFSLTLGLTTGLLTALLATFAVNLAGMRDVLLRMVRP
ncbi:MAG: oligosaccharide flippase family protein, partial [Candidatus Lambdaproteobacteria bacterium]|nr:oligosaccharide flippase family protein [Candidatus Lambdaproteobacteria bacterium]